MYSQTTYKRNFSNIVYVRRHKVGEENKKKEKQFFPQHLHVSYV